VKPFELFKPGKHTAMSGATLDFSEDMLRAAVAAYDPALHEAPIVVGHPKDNAPAFGWIKGLEFADDGKVRAIPDQINADFAELVASGAYKKRSASWYLPDSPANPKPGTLYLRHVAFLGAQPPAIKGLKDVSFAEGEEGVVEFADAYTTSIIASTFRRIREWIIGEKGVDEADKVIPAYVVSDLEAEARRPMETPAPAASFSENDMTPEQIQALQAENARLKADNDKLKADAAKAADFAERETSLAAREAKIARGEIETRVDGMIKSGKAVPAQKKSIVDFAMSLADAEAVVDFGEGDKAKKVSQREAYLLGIENGPQVIDFGERARATDDGHGGETVEQIQKRIAGQVANGGKTDK
jgi:hypothetical protein